MKVLQAGHRYELAHLDGDHTTVLQFVSRPPLNRPIEGVTNQEVLRAVIDRIIYLNSEVPWDGNKEILHHLRMVIVLHECRALLRHVEKGYILPEQILLGEDGHFLLLNKNGEATHATQHGATNRS